MSDALHSFSDILTTFVVIITLYMSRKPADKLHPFGHGRAEDVGGLLVSFIIVLVGGRFFFDSIKRLSLPSPLEISYSMIAIILLTALIKFVLGYATKKVAKRVDSPLIESDSSHHYSDFFITLSVGGGLFFIKQGFVELDSILGIFISVSIIYWAIRLGKEFIDKLIGKKAPPHVYEKMRKLIKAFSSIQGYHDITVHSYGRYNVISVHIELDKNMSLSDAHAIADRLEKKVASQGLGKCIVHMDAK